MFLHDSGECMATCEHPTACRADIEQDDLGGGNWSGGQIFEAGRQVARVSYNGRVWEMADGATTSAMEFAGENHDFRVGQPID